MTTFLVWLLIVLAGFVVLAIVGAVVAYFLAPVRLTLPDHDPYLSAYGDQPHAPWAALRSPAERLSHSRSPAAVAAAGAAVGGAGLTGGAADRSPGACS